MGRWATLLLCSFVGVAAASCFGPTEIDVVLSTNLDCSVVAQNGAMVRVGSPATIQSAPSSSISTNACASGGSMGDIVVVPSGSPDDIVSIEIVMGVGQSTESCLPETSSNDCIYARRQIPFKPHSTLTLPVFLDSVCAGVNCPDTETCVAGQCVGSIIDPNSCDGGTCTPPTDGSVPPLDAPVIDAPVIDVPGVDAPCSTATMCNGSCVDLQTSKTNCGACGFDCSGGTCSGGTCLLEPNIVGNSLTIYSGYVWVSTTTGMARVATQGGTATLATSGVAYWVASTPTDLAWIEKKGSSSPDIFDFTLSKTFIQGTYTPEMLAVSGSAYAYSESSSGLVVFQPTTGSAATYFTFAKGAVIRVAMSKQIVYACDGTQLGWSTGQPTFVNNVSSPTAIALDDVSTPNVYVVEGGTHVAQRDSTLSLVGTYAAGTTSIGSIVWDATKQTIVANATTEMDIASGGAFKPIVVLASKAVPGSVAVDSTAVYWLGQTGGVYKHAK